MKKLGQATAFVVLTIVSIYTSSWAVVKLWGWSLAPLGVPQIGQAEAYCLLILVGLPLMSIRTKTDQIAKKPFDEELAGMAAVGILGPPVAVGLGWVARWLLGS